MPTNPKLAVAISVTGTSSLRADISYFLCFTRKKDVCVTPFLILFQCPAVSPEFGDHALIGFLTVGFVRINPDWLSSQNTQDNLCGINSARFSIDRSETCRLKHEWLCAVFFTDREPQWQKSCSRSWTVKFSKSVLYSLLFIVLRPIYVNRVLQSFGSDKDFMITWRKLTRTFLMITVQKPSTQGSQ